VTLSTGNRKTTVTKRLVGYFAVSISAVILFIACSGDSNDPGIRENQLIPAVEAVRASYGSLPLTERLSGVVKAKNQVEIYPEISAVVTAVNVQSGDEVKQGQPLVSLRNKEFQERVNQARAALQIARAQARQAEARQTETQSKLRRLKALDDQGLTNDAELESVQTEALSAEADVELAHARVDQAASTVAEEEEALAQTIIRAPVDGTVGNRDAEVGMMVGPGTRLFTLGQLDSVRVEIVLTDRMLTYIETGQRTEIEAATAPSGIMNARLSRISPFLHPVTHSTEAEIDLANPGHVLKSGMFVTVDVFYGESEKATLVPLSALYENPMTGGTGVYVSRDTLSRIQTEPTSGGNSQDLSLTDPVAFQFVPVEVIAKGRMSAGIRGIEPESWVVTIGQDLLAGDSGQARVRPVDWSWVEQLQNLQREDLLEEMVNGKQAAGSDTTMPGI
jgi:RND family efflux transporter MFP subunit